LEKCGSGASARSSPEGIARRNVVESSPILMSSRNLSLGRNILIPPTVSLLRSVEASIGKNVGTGLFGSVLTVGFVTRRYPFNSLRCFHNGLFVEVITADSLVHIRCLLPARIRHHVQTSAGGDIPGAHRIRLVDTSAANRARTLDGHWLTSCFVSWPQEPIFYSPVIVGIAFTVLYFISEALI
jgi:hypothetical protein